MARYRISAVAGASLAATMTGAIAQDKSITINSFGGPYEVVHRQCVITPFEQETGARVQIVTAYSADAFAQLRAQKDAPQFDVIHFSGGQEIVAAAEGLLSPIEEGEIANLADLYDFAKANLAGGEGPVMKIVPVGLVYNSELMPRAPEKWADLLDPAFREHLLMVDISNGFGMQAFLMLNRVRGGDFDNIQPGLDAVRELLDQGGVVTVSTNPEILREFAQNEAWLAGYGADYAYTLRSSGLPVKFAQPAEGTPASYVTINLVEGRPNRELALKFIDITLSSDAQACFANAMRYSPTNRKVVLAPDVAADAVYGEEAVGGLIRFDPRIVEANRAKWVEEWGKTIAR